MKVLHLCIDDAPASGVNTFCTGLMRALADAGVECERILSFTPPAQKPDIVHIHGLWLAPQHKTAAWAWRNGIPVVWSTHGMTAPWSMRNKPWKKFPAWWLYQKRDLSRAALIHATTETEAEWNRRMGLRNRQVVVPLGTKAPDASPCGGASDSRDESFRVLFVGRIHPVKGVENLVRAASLLAGDGLSVRIVGPDELGLVAGLKEIATPNVSFVGAKFGEDLDAEYGWCDVLVLPSFTENFGGVVVDALVRGKPVVASRFAPWKELETNRCGWWTPNDVPSLVQALRTAMGTPKDELKAMGERGRLLATSKYTWSAVARAMVDAYSEVAAGSRSR